MNPQISIIIPVYNAEQYLHRSLDSIIAQSFTDWECILVDDGSTDKSGNICDEYASKDTRFHVIHKQNEGVSKARNLGIQKSKGDYIAFLDADDYLDELFLETMIKHSNYPLVIGGYRLFGSLNIMKGPDSFQCIDVVKDIPKMWNKSILPYWIYVWGKLFKNSVIKSNGIAFDKDITYLEDFCFVMKYLSCIDNVCLIKDVLVNHFVEKGRLSKYFFTFEQLDFHMKNMEKCISAFEIKCNGQVLYLMRKKTASDFFRNFIFFLKYGQDSWRVKLCNVAKYEEVKKSQGLYRYVKIHGLKRWLYWRIWVVFEKTINLTLSIIK